MLEKSDVFILIKSLKIATLFILTLYPASSSSLNVIAWNVESGGARVSALRSTFEQFDDCDIWGLSEVRNQDWIKAFEKAAELGQTSAYSFVLGTTGGSDRLAVLYNEERLRLLGTRELHWINPEARVRAPLVAHFLDNVSSKEFIFVVNHLYRSRAGKRHLQSQQLNDWAVQQTLPIIAVGDYNYDWGVEDGDIDHDEGYDHLIENDIFRWVRPPDPLIKTQSSRYNSVLDFVFVAGPALNWPSQSTIIQTPNDFPDTHLTSDHRPVSAAFSLETSEDLDSSSEEAVELPTEGIADARINPLVESTESLETAELETPMMFLGQPELLWLEDANEPDREMKLLSDLAFIDSTGKKWLAPKGAIVDGASIPSIFWNKFIGPPFVGDYRRASIVHDFACQKKAENWRDTHRMFYEACLVGGVSKSKANIMYWAVRTFGPKWEVGAESLTPEDLPFDPELIHRLYEVRDVIESDPQMDFETVETLIDAAANS